MTADPRERRLRLVAARRADRLREALPSLRTSGFAQPGDLPGWIDDERRAILRATSVPDATLPESAGDGEFLAWAAAFLRRAGIGERFYLATGIEQFAWLDCQVGGERWLEEVVACLGHDLTFVAHGGNALAVIYAEEHDYQAFHAGPDRRRDPSGRPPGDSGDSGDA